MPEAGSHGKNEPSGSPHVLIRATGHQIGAGLAPGHQTMTTLGASGAIPEAIAAASEIMSEFVEIAGMLAWPD